MPPPYALALISDDERLLTLLSWQLMSEHTEVSIRLFLPIETLSNKNNLRAELSTLSNPIDAVVTCLRHQEALALVLQYTREQAWPTLICSPAPSLEEATLCLRQGAADYLDRPWRGVNNLTHHVAMAINKTNKSKALTCNHPQEKPLTSELSDTTASEQISLHALIDTSLTFQEALTPIEDELRRFYLMEVLKEVGSVNGAAKRAGVDRSNFKRLLKRYDVTKKGESS